MWGKQTLVQLAESEQVSIRTIQNRLNKHRSPKTSPLGDVSPQSIYLVIDAYYRKRGDGTIVFRSSNLQQNLLWRDIGYETIADYVWGVEMLLDAGWHIMGIVIDGRRGTLQALEKYTPVQHCQFHQLQTVTKYLTRKPKSEAAQALKRVASTLTQADQPTFARLLDYWYQKYGTLTKERTYHPGGGWSYTHENLRSCYFSLLHNLPHLFTYRDHPCMPNTTNTLDGSISHLRTLHRIHRGAKLHKRRNFTEEILRGKPTK